MDQFSSSFYSIRIRATEECGIKLASAGDRYVQAELLLQPKDGSVYGLKVDGDWILLNHPVYGYVGRRIHSKRRETSWEDAWLREQILLEIRIENEWVLFSTCNSTWEAVTRLFSDI